VAGEVGVGVGTGAAGGGGVLATPLVPPPPHADSIREMGRVNALALTKRSYDMTILLFVESIQGRRCCPTKASCMSWTPPEF